MKARLKVVNSVGGDHRPTQPNMTATFVYRRYLRCITSVVLALDSIVVASLLDASTVSSSIQLVINVNTNNTDGGQHNHGLLVRYV